MTEASNLPNRRIDKGSILSYGLVFACFLVAIYVLGFLFIQKPINRRKVMDIKTTYSFEVSTGSPSVQSILVEHSFFHHTKPKDLTQPVLIFKRILRTRSKMTTDPMDSDHDKFKKLSKVKTLFSSGKLIALAHFSPRLNNQVIKDFYSYCGHFIPKQDKYRPDQPNADPIIQQNHPNPNPMGIDLLQQFSKFSLFLATHFKFTEQNLNLKTPSSDMSLEICPYLRFLGFGLSAVASLIFERSFFLRVSPQTLEVYDD